LGGGGGWGLAQCGVEGGREFVGVGMERERTVGGWDECGSARSGADREWELEACECWGRFYGGDYDGREFVGLGIEWERAVGGWDDGDAERAGADRERE